MKRSRAEGQRNGAGRKGSATRSRAEGQRNHIDKHGEIMYPS